MARKRVRKKARSRLRLTPVLVVLGCVGLGVGLLLLWLLWPFWQLAGQLADRPMQQPARLYAAAPTLEVGLAGSADSWQRRLAALGYADAGERPPRAGELQVVPGGLVIHVRATPTTTGLREAGVVRADFSGGAVSRLSWQGQAVSRLELEAPLLASFYGPDRRERRPIRLDELPEQLTEAVLAAEDARFFGHGGVSPRGIVRALWVNLRAGGVRQGGSTLTQQLVKNMFLSHERTVGRKFQEVVLALLVDWRYSKPAILNAYLNEIYWGEREGINLMGVGAAAEGYFGKPATHLTLCESALLAGMIQSPGTYDPGRNPERARERRDWVLGRMGEQGRLTAAEVATARGQALCYSPPPKRTALETGYIRQAAQEEVAERFGISALADSGHLLLTTLSLEDQEAAEEAVRWGSQALEEGWEKGRTGGGVLQAALVSITPGSGAITAYVGGRDFQASQFDRVRLAERQAGSAFKPVVYATAFERGTVLPAGLLLDEPLQVAIRGGPLWEPQNDDRQFRGAVTARRALEESLNVPTARLALATGLEEVAAMASALGLDRRLPIVPAMALGALEVTPLELATVYATLADGGIRHQPHLVTAVLSPAGEPLTGEPLAPPRAVLTPESAYLVTSVLEGVFDRGTARVVRQWGMVDRLAGKTGTTNDRRDSWFAGYSPDRATLVWVGYDDNSPTRLSGSRAALPIWNRFVWRRRPRGGYRPARAPAGLTTVTVDPLSGELATGHCPEVATEYFPRDSVPTFLCHLHASREELRRQQLDADAPRRQRFRRWLDRVFRGKKPPPSDPPPP